MAAFQNTIEFECPRCLTSVRVEAKQAGKRIDCPSCQFSLLVPSRSIAPDLFEDIFDSLQPKSGDTADRETAKEPDDAEFATRGSSTSKTAEPEFEKPPAQPRRSSSAAEELSGSKTSNPETPRRASELPAIDLTPSLSDEDPAAGLETPLAADLAQPNPVDPFAVDKHAALKLEGFHEEFAIDDIWGIKCKICDTRVHVNKNQVGTDIECPVCFTTIHVTPLEKNPKSEQRWLQSKPAKSNIFPEHELKLSEPIERPKPEIVVDPSYGLLPVTDDLLSPKKEPAAETSPDVAAAKPVRTSSISGPAGPPTVPQKSRRELFEESQNRKGGKRRPADQPSDIIKPKFEKSVEPDATDEQDDGSDKPIPKLDFRYLSSSVFQMLGSPGLLWRAVIAAGLIGVGSAIMHPINNAYERLGQQGTPTISDWLSSFGFWLLFGGVPYFAGTLLLWLVCSYVFREAARGFRHVRKFRSRATSEFTSTFLLFAFSYFVAGLPVTLFPLLVTPFRFLFAPPLLLGAWFNKSPLAVVAVDAFANADQRLGEWKSFYGFNVCLIVLAVIGGLLMSVSTWILSAFCSLFGAAIIVFASIAFAAATGWHCGRVVQKLETNA